MGGVLTHQVRQLLVAYFGNQNALRPSPPFEQQIRWGGGLIGGGGMTFFSSTFFEFLVHGVAGKLNFSKKMFFFCSIVFKFFELIFV
jgi:hypothetical protein